MKICFIGLGSIAVRHIKNLRVLFGADILIDVVRSGFGNRPTEAAASHINHIYYGYDDIQLYYDVVFITNPTREHYETLREVQNIGKHFFIEKPVFETGNEDCSKLDLRKNSVYYVACPLRYMDIVQYLKQNIDFSSIYSIRAISSSYLPEWRPGVDYRQTYSAKKELGGGVSIDLIHEWDYITYLLGMPQRVKSLIGKKSNLEINSDDIAVYIAEYEDKFVEIHLDYFGRVPVRTIEIFGKDDTIKADLLSKKIEFEKEGRAINLAEDRDMYQRKELKHFFEIVNGKAENDNSIFHACQTLRIARGQSLQ